MGLWVGVREIVWDLPGQALGAEGQRAPHGLTLRALRVWCHNTGQPRRSESARHWGLCQLLSFRKATFPTRASLIICFTWGCLSLVHGLGGGEGRSHSAMCLSMEPGLVAGSLPKPRVKRGEVCLPGRIPIPASVPRSSLSC